MIDDPRIHQQIKEHPYPLLFATVSGSHLYGFNSPDSDFDLRGAHLLHLQEVIGLRAQHDTIERSGIKQGLEIDLVTHHVKKFFGLMLKKNGYVMEQLYSPLVLQTSPEHEELKSIGLRCLTKHHVYHYLGFADTQWRLFRKENPPRIKPLLYLYRVILTGIHLMRTGCIEANLVHLNDEMKLPYIPDLIERKKTGKEKSTLDQADLDFHEREYDRLMGMLKEAHEVSHLPEEASGRDALHDLLVRIRMRGCNL
ncbi:nucleotidyltransferase domain-containing protein [bacterium]|nr:nucleotidyltransferase domain-containing protein [bacterium]